MVSVPVQRVVNATNSLRSDCSTHSLKVCREKRRLAKRSCGLQGRRRHAVRRALRACGHAPWCAAAKPAGTLLKRGLASTSRRAGSLPMGVSRMEGVHGGGRGKWRSILGRLAQHLCAYAAAPPQRIAKPGCAATEACKLRKRPFSRWCGAAMSSKMDAPFRRNREFSLCLNPLRTHPPWMAWCSGR